MHTSLRQYRAVDAVARLGSFVEAAKALHVTPAALSSLVRELEKDLGFPVFERTTRKVRVSESGEQYLPHVHRVLAEVAGAERCALDVRSGQPHVIRLATTQTVITTLLPNAFRSFRQKWPQGRLYPLDILSGEIGDALQSGQADIAIGALLPSDERFDLPPFPDDALALLLRGGAPTGTARNGDLERHRELPSHLPWTNRAPQARSLAAKEPQDEQRL